MSGPNAKVDLKRYLQIARDAMLWKLDGLSEYDVRRPLVPTARTCLAWSSTWPASRRGTSARRSAGGSTSSCPGGTRAPSRTPTCGPPPRNPARTSSACTAALGPRGRPINALPLDAVGRVAWWPPERREATLHRILIHVIAETNRHAGHADIVRELIDGAAGLREDNDNMGLDPAAWQSYRDRLQSVAREAAADEPKGR